MKKNIIYSMLFALVALVMTSCGDKKSEGLSRITYYPSIELQGDSYVVWEKGTPFVEPGYVSLLNGEDVTDKVTIATNLDVNKSGIYTVSYTTMKNEDGFDASASRTVVVLDPNSPIEGFYLTQPNSYRVREGAQVAYGKAFEILVIDNGDGTVSVDDLLGGWYCQRAGYGTRYALAGVLSIGADGSVTCEDSYLPGWGDSHSDFTGTFDAENGIFQVDCLYAEMNFVQTWVKE
jgi:hypothetical protein